MPITYDRKSFFDAVRDSVFDGWMSAKQVDGIEAILDGWEKLQPVGDTRFLAYMLGTTKWETASTMQPIEEYGHGRGRSYGVPAGPWHQVYDGRGDVQLTWQANYRKATARLRALGVLTEAEDLERTPALALRADIAAAVMFYGMLEAWFTGKKLADYFHGTASDWIGARRIINGTDHAGDVAALAEHFFAALKTSLIFTANASRVAMLDVAPVAASISKPAASLVESVKPLAPAPAAAVVTAWQPGLFSRLAQYFGRH